MLHVHCRWEGGPDEVVGDGVVFVSVQQNPIRMVDRSPGSPHLLVVVHDRAGPLEVDDESKVWLVKTHSESDRSHQRFHFIVE